MARKRMIDPSIWTDEGMAELSPIEQVMYIGMFSIADDCGRLKASPTFLKLSLPTVLGDVSKDQVEDHLSRILANMAQLKRYRVDGVDYLYFANYEKWQRIEKPQPSRLPEPDESSQFGERSGNGRGTVDDESRLVEKKRIEEKGTEENTPQPPKGDEGEVPTPLPKYSADFEVFWSQYPPGSNKAKTYTHWKKLSADDRHDAIAGLARWKSCERWRHGYVKSADIWVRDRWWDNDPPLPKPNGTSNGHAPPGKATDDDIDQWVTDLKQRKGIA